VPTGKRIKIIVVEGEGRQFKKRGNKGRRDKNLEKRIGRSQFNQLKKGSQIKNATARKRGRQEIVG